MFQPHVECLSMIPICFEGTVKDWIDLGIVERSILHIDLSPEMREWLEDNTGSPYIPPKWWWDHFVEEGEVAMYFMDSRHATLFKLTWL